MRTLESWILAYLLNSLWQIPLVFMSAWGTARLVRRFGPGVEHRVWVSALLLEIILPLCQFRLHELWRPLWGLVPWLWGAGVTGGDVRIVVGGATVAHGVAVLRLPAMLLTAIVAVYLCSLLYFAGRLGWRLWKTQVLRQLAEYLPLENQIAQELDRCHRRLHLPRRTVQIAISPTISGPVTVGVRQWTVLLPPGFVEKAGAHDLGAVFAHELAHLRRWDFAKNLLYELLALPIAYHPLFSFTRSHVAETREMVCDAIAAEAVMGREHYAHSLLRLASILSSRTTANLHAIGIFDANTFERRIMNLTRKHLEIRGVRRLAVAAACGVVALATCASALAFRIDAKLPMLAQAKQVKKVAVSAGVMEQNIIRKVAPVYPAVAKKAKIEGTVVLATRIGKDGEPKEIHVKSGPVPLEQSAIEAVRQWRWKPYLLNGNPVEVDTEISVVYSLAG